jgi:putative oxidoreductase
MFKRVLRVLDLPVPASAALLALCIVEGVSFAFFHGWGKSQNPFGWMGPNAAIPGVFQALAALAEVEGGIGWAIGLLTPIASLAIACPMAVAIYMHAVVLGHPFVRQGGSCEPAAIYFLASVVFIAVGRGRFLADAAIYGREA